MPLHSFGALPSYDWTLSEQLITLMQLNVPLDTSQPLQNKEFVTIMDTCPPMAHLTYKAPATVPMTERLMIKRSTM
ncbi:hypothetical protein BD408DRAFT_411799 [Parasitella parasitica]|nr:hypothetical protein BD408DRAFT_411799 [Parasitella parasitica]